MNPYTTRTRVRIQPHDLANTLFADAFVAAPALTALERHRGWQAEAEVGRLLTQHGVKPPTAQSHIATARQALAAGLVRVRALLAGAVPTTASSIPALVSTRPRMAD